MRIQRMLWPTKVGGGIWLYTVVQDSKIVHSSHTPFSPCKVIPGELVQSSGTDITLDDVLMILDEHYNNVKVLDALNQELFQL